MNGEKKKFRWIAVLFKAIERMNVCLLMWVMNWSKKIWLYTFIPFHSYAVESANWIMIVDSFISSFLWFCLQHNVLRGTCFCWSDELGELNEHDELDEFVELVLRPNEPLTNLNWNALHYSKYNQPNHIRKLW